ncbi:LLM class F420-dependent oxidoreductase [Sporichthya sp.]|uniref:LLM class F420-dependent oxidoreductase n=1 Tax=Sporichthya sp. TaxID=65475 RepID=UPI0018374583|nr:LLM class F420-dependent oxidoreductase [Sporichthya sp.]MBA3744772.1 LLM class F420-dependent oxidoreductase [Sporichthya sp.]
MQVGIHNASFSWPGGPASIGPTIAELGQAAEAAGVGYVSFMDHFFQIPPVGPAEEPMLEGYTALGFLAAHTSTVKLQLLCTGVTYRHPGLLAKTVTTLDVLSGGRAHLGIGAAWFDREHDGLGVPFPPVAERFERLEETLQICLQMWSENNGPFNGKHYQLAETLCVPAPVSSPRPPIMVAGGGEKKTLKFVARYADANNFFGGPDEVKAKLEILKQHCENEGRDYTTITHTTLARVDPETDVDGFLREAEAMHELGVSVIFVVPRGDSPAKLADKLGKDVVPRLSELG